MSFASNNQIEMISSWYDGQVGNIWDIHQNLENVFLYKIIMFT